MNKRTIKTIVVLMLVCLLPILVLSACGNKEKNVSSIQIVQGAFKEIYALDEGMNLANAKIQVTYTDGSVANVAITKEMVSGFDTSTTTTGRTLTVTYKGKSTNFIYKVQSSISIETSFRFNISVVENEVWNEVLIKADKASTVPEGVYAARFTLASTGGIAFSEPTLKLGEGFKMEIYSASVSSIVFVVYSESGYDSLVDGDTILSVQASKPSSLGTINVQNGSISNGIIDFIVPQTNLSLGE